MPAPDLELARVRSLAEYGHERLDTLCAAVGISAPEQRSARAVFQMVSESWGQAPLGDAPGWENDLTDDGTPFEFSLGFETEKPELRLLYESQADAGPLSQHSSWHAGLALQARLQARKMCDCSQLQQILPLFEPSPDFLPRFSLWHAAVLGEHGASLFKAYLNPEIVGVTHSRGLVQSALERLGMSDAWSFVDQRLADDTRLPYFSLDLKASQTGRVKLYATAVDADSVERLVADTGLQPGDATRWLSQLAHSEGPYTGRPILTCFAFRRGANRPEATVHVPIRNYAPNDQEAFERTRALLTPAHANQLEAALNALGKRPLWHSHGVLSYVSLRLGQGRVRVTTYLAPGAYTTGDTNDRRSSGTIPTGRPSTIPP
jgi:DMATS type aromatic prenyltransferase